MRNTELRKEIKALGVFVWEVAEKMKVSEMTIHRQLRKELSADELAAFRAAAREIATAKEA